jgi:indole-3-glycerol phosphate synthase
MNILEKIARDKQAEVDALKRRLSLEGIRELASMHPVHCDVVSALSGEEISLIAEIKKASPSKGELCMNLQPAKLARDYITAGVAMISVITEINHFKGAPAFLREVRQVAGIPVLRKDFIFDLHQVGESKLMGADAVLLIVALLGERLPEFIEETRRVGITPLVEVHNEEEMHQATAAHARIIGVNNRDLTTFEVSLSTFENLAPMAPEGTILIAESGIANAQDAKRMQKAGAHAILVGEQLVTSADPIAAAKNLLG